ncbi:unnamed protein product, partial [Rotaria sp. Silwood1]
MSTTVGHLSTAIPLNLLEAENEKNKLRRSSIIHEFCLNTSTHGLPAYLEYPTQIDVNIVPEWPQYFPAFSFCNIGKILFDQFVEPFINYTKTLNLTNTNDTTTLSSLQASYRV